MPDATLNAACLDAQRALPGWYGKLPGTGDFVERRLPGALARAWERWFARGIALMHEVAGQSLVEQYASAPIWRFAIPAGAGDGAVQFGCIAPSCDRVGRRYPLLVTHAFDLAGFSREIGAWANASLPGIGEALAQAIAAAYEPEQFDRALAERIGATSGEAEREIERRSGWPNLLDYFDPDGMTSFWWTGTEARGRPAAQSHTGVLDNGLFLKLFGGGDALRSIDG